MNHSSQPKAIINIKNLVLRRTKTFSLEVGELNVTAGQVLCVTGANGSGKTTLVESIVGLLRIDRGSIRVKGEPTESSSTEIKKQLGYIPDDDSWVIAELTAEEYFNLLISVYKKAGVHEKNMRKKLSELTKALNFTSTRQLMGTLSHGNKKKVQIIAALLHQPKLLIVDELRNGLDPIAIKEAELLLRSASARGTAIIAATHDLWWAERFATDIIMLRQGKIMIQDKTSHIVTTAGSLEAKFMELYKSGAKY